MHRYRKWSPWSQKFGIPAGRERILAWRSCKWKSASWASWWSRKRRGWLLAYLTESSNSLLCQRKKKRSVVRDEILHRSHSWYLISDIRNTVGCVRKHNASCCIKTNPDGSRFRLTKLNTILILTPIQKYGASEYKLQGEKTVLGPSLHGVNGSWPLAPPPHPGRRHWGRRWNTLRCCFRAHSQHLSQ